MITKGTSLLCHILLQMNYQRDPPVLHFGRWYFGIVMWGHSVFRRSIIKSQQAPLLRSPPQKKWTQVLHMVRDSINLYWLQTVQLGYTANPKLGRTPPVWSFNVDCTPLRKYYKVQCVWEGIDVLWYGTYEAHLVELWAGERLSLGVMLYL